MNKHTYLVSCFEDLRTYCYILGCIRVLAPGEKKRNKKVKTKVSFNTQFSCKCLNKIKEINCLQPTLVFLSLYLCNSMS